MSTEIFGAIVERSHGHTHPDKKVLIQEAQRFFESKREQTQAEIKRHIASSREGWSVLGAVSKPSLISRIMGKDNAAFHLHLLLNGAQKGSITVNYLPDQDVYSLSINTAATQLESSQLENWSHVVARVKDHVGAIVFGVQPDTELLTDTHVEIRAFNLKLQEQQQALDTIKDALGRADWRDTQRTLRAFIAYEEELPQTYKEVEALVSTMDSSVGLPLKILQTTKQSGATIRATHTSMLQRIAELKDQIRFTNRENSLQVLDQMYSLHRTHVDTMRTIDSLLSEHKSRRAVVS